MFRCSVTCGVQTSKNVFSLCTPITATRCLSNRSKSSAFGWSSSGERKYGRPCCHTRLYHDSRDRPFGVIGAFHDTPFVRQHRGFDGIVFVASETNDGLPTTTQSTKQVSFKDKLDTCKNVKDILKLVDIWKPVLTADDAAIALQRIGQKYDKRKSSLLENPAFQLICISLINNELSIESLVKSLKGVAGLNLNLKHELTAHLCETVESRLLEKSLSIGEIASLIPPMQKLQGVNSLFLQNGLEEIEAMHAEIEAGDIPVILKALSVNSSRQMPKKLMSTVTDSIQNLAPIMTKSEISRTLNYLTVLDHENLKCLFALSKHCSPFITDFTDSELAQVLRALVYFQIGDSTLLKVLEAEIPEKIPVLSCETLARIMQYFDANRYLSVPLFDTVSKYFVECSEKFTTAQLTHLILPFGRLNFEPTNAGEVFEKIEETLNYRWYEFKPLDVVDLLHACVLLGRFPLNFIHKVISIHFLQKLEGPGTNVDFYVKSRLSQIVMAIHLECRSYHLPKLPRKYQTRTLSRAFDLDALESKPEFLVHHVQKRLTELLGGDIYFAFWVQTPYIYHIDIQIKLDKDGCVLPAIQEEGIHTQIALCLTEMSEHCTNCHHMTGIEAIRQRHLELLGYQLAQLPYYELQKLKTKKEWHEYLHMKIFPTSPRLQW